MSKQWREEIEQQPDLAGTYDGWYCYPVPMTPAEQAQLDEDMKADLGTIDNPGPAASDQPISAEENDDSLPSF